MKAKAGFGFSDKIWSKPNNLNDDVNWSRTTGPQRGPVFLCCGISLNDRAVLNAWTQSFDFAAVLAKALFRNIQIGERPVFAEDTEHRRAKR